MAFALFNFFSSVLSVLFYALLIFGLIQCKKHSFSGGFYFFLFLIIGQIYSIAISPIIRNYIDRATDPHPMGMTLGELVMWISLTNSSIMSIIEIIAYSFLVIGLYRMWKSKLRS